jgi:hypothetical protein
MNRYSVLTVLRSRMPNPPQKIESLQYFVKVLISKTADLTPQEEKALYCKRPAMPAAKKTA